MMCVRKMFSRGPRALLAVGLLVMLFALAACGGGPTAAPTTQMPPPPSVTQPPPTTDTIGHDGADSGVATAVSIPFPTLAPAASTASPAAAIIDAALSQLAQNNAFSGAVLVARGGDVLLSQGYGPADRTQNIPNTSQTRFRIGSLTKQFTAMAVLILQSQGRLNVQDPVCSYIVDCPAAWQGMTLHHVLTHTAGIPDLLRFPDFEATKGSPSTPAETVARFRNLPLEFAPGTQWRYSNSGYILLGLIIEQAAGQPYEQFLQENIFGPLGMVNSGYDHNLDTLAQGYRGAGPADFIDMSIPFAAGALYSSVEDLYRWDQALYTEQLVPQALLEQMFTAVPTGMPDPDAGYGYGWVIGTSDERPVIAHGGVIEGFSARIERYPEQRTTLIVLANDQTIDVRSLMATTLAPALWQE